MARLRLPLAAGVPKWIHRVIVSPAEPILHTKPAAIF